MRPTTGQHFSALSGKLCRRSREGLKRDPLGGFARFMARGVSTGGRRRREPRGECWESPGRGGALASRSCPSQ